MSARGELILGSNMVMHGVTMTCGHFLFTYLYTMKSLSCSRACKMYSCGRKEDEKVAELADESYMEDRNTIQLLFGLTFLTERHSCHRWILLCFYSTWYCGGGGLLTHLYLFVDMLLFCYTCVGALKEFRVCGRACD